MMRDYWSNAWFLTRGDTLAVLISTPDAQPEVGEIVKINSIRRVVIGVEWGSRRGFALAVRNEV